MASSGYVQAAVLLLALQLVCLGAADADHETGTVIPAESRPCVDCHAFEFMQRALQDLKKTAFNLDARDTDPLVYHDETNNFIKWCETNRLIPSVIETEEITIDHEPVVIGSQSITQTETLVLRAERRALCDCMPTNSLR